MGDPVFVCSDCCLVEMGQDLMEGVFFPLAWTVNGAVNAWAFLDAGDVHREF